EDEEIDAERPRPHPRGDGGLGGTVEAGHHGDPCDAAEHHRDAESGNESPEASQGAYEREENGCERDDGVDGETALHPRQEGSAERGHRSATARTATNDAALSAKTSAGPAAATRTPPMAGPTARPMLIGSAFSATARVSSDCGTRSAVIACQVGVFIATPIPSANVKTRSVVGVMRSTNAKTASSAAAASIQVWVTSSSRRRSTIS